MVIEIDVNGVTYYVPVNMVQYLTESLENTSSSTITLYSTLSQSPNQTSYPYIQIRPFSAPVLYTAYNQTSVLDSVSVDFPPSSVPYRYQSQITFGSFFLLFVLFLCVISRRFK